MGEVAETTEARCCRCKHTREEHAGSWCYCACEDDPALYAPAEPGEEAVC